MKLTTLAPLLVAAAVSSTTFAGSPYTPAAGQSAPMERGKKTVHTSGGGTQEQDVYTSPPKDHHGNAQGHQYDLAVDGAFEGQTVAVLHFYTGGGFDFALPKAAIREKGFSVFRWIDDAPPPEELERALAKSSQLWIISGDQRHLNDKHLAVIKKFFDAGHGVYIWGDNPPYTGDANFVGEALLGATMTPDSYVQGEQVVGVQDAPGKPGVRRNHLLTTGIEHLYEGHTVATILPNQTLEPLIYGSAGNLIAASYDRGGKRAILDGGFTRLYLKWDTAGTARYVKNAAAWLANAERFGATTAAR